MDSKIIKLILISFFFNLQASAIEFKGKFIQGHFILGKTQSGAKISIDKKEENPFQEIVVEILADLDNYNHVFVIL